MDESALSGYLQKLNLGLTQNKVSSDVEKSLSQLLRQISAEGADKKAVVGFLVQNGIVDTVSSILKKKDSFPVSVLAAVSEILAEVAKLDSGRQASSQEAIIISLLDLLLESDANVLLQVCRALGNICYDNDTARGLVKEHDGVSRLIQLLKNLLEKENLPQNMRTITSGCLLNLTDTYEEIQEQALDAGILDILMQYLMKFHSDDDVVTHCLLVLGCLAETNVRKIPFAEPVVVLTKLTFEEVQLAQLSVRGFLEKKGKSSRQHFPFQRHSHDGQLADGLNILNSEYFTNGCEDLEMKGRKRGMEEPNSEVSKKKWQLSSFIEQPRLSNDDESSESPHNVIQSPLPHKKKNKKKRLKTIKETHSVEDQMDSDVFRHFAQLVDAIIESVEGVDLSLTIDEDTDFNPETMIHPDHVHELMEEAAKLNKLQLMSLFSTDRLVHLLLLLQRNIVDGTKLLPFLGIEDQDDADEMSLERVLCSVDATLASLYIMSSSNMTDKIFLEEVIERAVSFVKYQLQNTIFPAMDPAYRSNPKSKDGYDGSIKQKRAHKSKVKNRSILLLYNKLSETVQLLSDVLGKQLVPDTIVLQVSTLAVSTFFVEDVNELQLNSLKLVRAVFSQYEKHRPLILEDILASIARLPTSKRNLRNYYLNSEESIQMLSALIMQMIHCSVKLPHAMQSNVPTGVSSFDDAPKSKVRSQVSDDALIITNFQATVTTAVHFLSTFLMKCISKNEEMDYKLLFENFISDLLSTVNKPEWPASGLLLTLLGRILVKNFSNKAFEMPLRTASLDYLGIVAAGLCKGFALNQECQLAVSEVIQCFRNSDSSSKSNASELTDTQILQKALIHFLNSNADNEPALYFSKQFLIAQWFCDASSEISSPHKVSIILKEDNKSEEAQSKQSSKGAKKTGYEENKKITLGGAEPNTEFLAVTEQQKQFLLSLIEVPKSNTDSCIDYKAAELILQHLSFKKNHVKKFDSYLTQILHVLGETTVGIRTKAMKCLSFVVEANPSILSRPDICKGVHGRLLDQSTSVREAAVDLLGKYILIRPDLINQYYEMLTNRILDTGVSVRKKVINILKNICVQQPDFPKTSEICAKIIRRVNDEDGIRKLVGEVFQSLWFTPVSKKKPELLLQKVKNISQVVETCQDVGLEWFEELLKSLFKDKENHDYSSVIKACKEIVDCLVENLLQAEACDNKDSSPSCRLVACMSTLHLLGKFHPNLVIPHVTTIVSYLPLKCIKQSDNVLLKTVTSLLELIVPLIEHPSDGLVVQIEEELIKSLFLRHIGLLLNSFSCLAVIVNKVSHNFNLIQDSFQKFYFVLTEYRNAFEKNLVICDVEGEDKLLRTLYVIGLFTRYFSFDVIENNKVVSLKEKVFDDFIYLNHHCSERIRIMALTGLGFMLIRHYDFMLGPEIKALYHFLLTDPSVSCKLKCQVIKNIINFLNEEEMQMMKKDADWNKMSKNEDLKEMRDVTSGMASTVIQIYLTDYLENVFHVQVSVRRANLQLSELVVGQGLVPPAQLVPYLICLGADDDYVIKTKADQLLQGIEKKYPGFLQMRSLLGIRMSFKFRQLLQCENQAPRGFHSFEDPVSRVGFLYSILKSTQHGRRAFILSLLKLFDEQTKVPLAELLYLADNIAHFPYTTSDEPLFIMHHIDIVLSVSGSNLLQTFQDALLIEDSGNEEEDFDYVLKRLPLDTQILQECITASQGCTLLLYLKQALKEIYSINDNKLQNYSPTDSSKANERHLSRKKGICFHPETVLHFLEKESPVLSSELTTEGREEMVKQYIHFKQLMLSIDPADEDDPTTPLLNPPTNLSSPSNADVRENLVITKTVKSPKNTLKKIYKVCKQANKRKPNKRRRIVVESDSDDSDFIR